MAMNIGDHPSTLFEGLSAFWTRFFRDTVDLEAFYNSSEVYLGQAYLDLLGAVLNIGLVDTPIFNKEVWKLFTIREDELSFSEGSAPVDDRFIYDMPEDAVIADFLQNTIFNPDVVLERDVDFDVENNDGLLRFRENLFRYYADADGIVQPISGVAWRYTTIETGNRFTDTKRTINWYDDSLVQGGDTLRLLGEKGVETIGAQVGDASYTYAAPDTLFTSIGQTFITENVGDIIEVFGHADDTLNGQFLIKSLAGPSPNPTVFLEQTTYVPQTSTAPGSLDWRLYKGVYYSDLRDYRIDYIRDAYLVGDVDSPYPLEPDNSLIYSIIREIAESEVTGVVLNTYPLVDSGVTTATISQVGSDVQLVITPGPFTPGMDPPPSPTYKDYHWVALGGSSYTNVGTYAIKQYINATTVLLVGDPADFDFGSPNADAWRIAITPLETQLSHRHLLEGSVKVFARRFFEGTFVEGVDYTVDYVRGIIIPLKPFDPIPIHQCSYEWMREVMFSGGGVTEDYTQGTVRQLSFWVPEVLIDKFNLYYNYGSMLNRFEASSENYKAFLRGIMYLYMSGPILRRIEGALNVAADLPLVRNDGEILTAYSDGVDLSGADGVMAAFPAYDEFSSVSTTFTELDVGGYIVIKSALSDRNEGSFRILNILGPNSVEIQTDFGVVAEIGLNWELTRRNTQIVTTSERQYIYPFLTPMREDVMDPANIDKLSFTAFEPLTEAFRVVDYIEDPYWWHNRHIPQILWDETVASRRFASTTLYNHIVGPLDDALVGDPGLYVNADDNGNVTQVVGSSAVRHSVGFVLFDRYIKLHLFYIQIHDDIALSTEFLVDLEDLILVAKPSYTYPYVEPAAELEDTIALLETFEYARALALGGTEDALQVADNRLIVGDPNSSMMVGDFFRYVEYPWTPAGVVTSPVPPPFVLPLPAGQRLLDMQLDAEVPAGPPVGAASMRVREGVDYDFQFRPTVGVPPVPASWTVTPTSAWNNTGALNFMGLALEIVNRGVVPIPDTTIGFTPLTVGGQDPGYVRANTDVPNATTQKIDRSISLHLDAGGGTPYTYP